VLVLTKPLGTGTVMAADMRYSAKGNWLAACLRSMLQSNASAARVLSSVCSAGDGNKDGMLCSGCTDVTGFGLLGHLLEMIQCSEDETSRLEADSKSGLSSKCSVELLLNDIPLLPGAAECVKNGILSSLQPQNIRCARAIGNATAGNGHAAYPLLFDPQTSGGLLAAVAPSVADECITALKAAGYLSASVIGRVVAREDDEFAPVVTLVV